MSCVRQSVYQFLKDRSGAVSIQMAFAVLPMMAATGAAIDFGRSVILSNQMQSAVDQATLTVANMSGSDAERKARADQIFAAAMLTVPLSSTFETKADGAVIYSAATNMPTMFTPFIASSVTINRVASAKPTVMGTPGTPGTPGVGELRDDSCIFSTGEDLDVDFNTLVFNGNPSVMLTNCSLISNKSMKCNGNNIGAAASYAHGSIQGCPNPHSGQELYPDIYQSVATSIDRVCGQVTTGLNLTASGVLPAASPSVKYVSRSGYTEMHVCGNLTLQGVGSLTGLTPNRDTVIVIENGGLTFANAANIAANRVTFVLAGNNANVSGAPAIVTWPSGNGNSAWLKVSASNGKDNSGTTETATTNPFKGHAIYQDPSVNIDMEWKPGSNLTVDGVIYFAKARLTIGGNINYGAGKCSKLVAGEFTLNGNVALKQDAASCTALGVQQYYRAPVPAVAGTSGTATASSYLVR